jgi:hypothetical protein
MLTFCDYLPLLSNFPLPYDRLNLTIAVNAVKRTILTYFFLLVPLRVILVYSFNLLH